MSTATYYGLQISPAALLTFSFPMMLSAIDPARRPNSSACHRPSSRAVPVGDGGSHAADRRSTGSPSSHRRGPSSTNPSQRPSSNSHTAGVTRCSSLLDGTSSRNSAGLLRPAVKDQTISAQSSYATLLHQLQHPRRNEPVQQRRYRTTGPHRGCNTMTAAAPHPD